MRQAGPALPALAVSVEAWLRPAFDTPAPAASLEAWFAPALDRRALAPEDPLLEAGRLPRQISACIRQVPLEPEAAAQQAAILARKELLRRVCRTCWCTLRDPVVTAVEQALPPDEKKLPLRRSPACLAAALPVAFHPEPPARRTSA